MPIYEYVCPDCGHQFEEMQKFSDPPLQHCPQCAKENVKKKISVSSFILQGGGWYKDHYGLKSESSTSGGNESKGESKAESKAESKPASTTESKPASTSNSSSGSST